jgi:GAF domain-containing protein
MNEVSPPSIVDRYQRLIEISRDLASTLDLDTLLDRLVHAAAELIGAEAASILLYDETNQQLHFQAATNLSEPLRGIRVPLENSIAGWIISHRQPIIVEDVTKSPRHFSQVSQVTNIHTRSLMGVPMITKGQIIGVLEVVNKIQGQFTQEDQELLSALGAQAAVAIEVTRLFQQSDLISDLVHEIRTPLASMTIASQILPSSRKR